MRKSLLEQLSLVAALIEQSHASAKSDFGVIFSMGA